MAEVYAGFLAHADHHIGRLLDYLEATDQLENTLIVVVSDNGASGEGGPNGSVNEMKFANGVPDDLAENLAKLDDLGGTEDLQPLPERLGDGVQHAVQDVEALRVQRRDLRPVHHLLAGRDEGARRDPRPVPPRDRHRADDPRRASASSRPRRSRATSRARSTASACATASTTRPPPSARKTQFYSMLGSRSIWHEGWKAVTTHPTLAGWGHFNDDEWELYHTDVDRSEVHNLAAEHPDKVRELVNIWFAEAGANGAFPLDDRSPVEILATPRPQLTAPRDRYVYYPDVAPVPSGRRSTPATARS